jgi:type IV pilus assembly protein PilB
MKCDEVRDELVAYARGELNMTRYRQVEEHLVRCGDCTREWESTRELLGVMRIADAASIKDLANHLIQSALERRASDIHVEMIQGAPRVRFRVDGVLHKQPDLAMPLEQYEPLIARLKYMAEMSLSEKQVPQDGRIAISHEGMDLDLRVSIFPYFTGESAVIRILDRRNVLIGLNRLGFLPKTQAQVETMLAQPGGLLFCTGPTGAGKTTLLYSMLNRLNRPEVKIMTIEDPVEYLIAGLNQANVNQKAGLMFANGLRAMMRQDPDILMVAEIRDMESLELAAGAAATGRLVMAAVHTPDATSAITRLLDVGLAPFLLAHSLVGIIGQRLVRRVCPACREPYQPPERLLGALGFPGAKQPESFVHGRGCEACAGTGYQGRMGLFEVLTLSRELGQMIADRASEAVLRARALELGLLWSFAADAGAKIAEGHTTVEEVERVLPSLFSPRSN